MFDGSALFLASLTSIWWVCQPPLVDQYPCLTDWHSPWLLRRLFGRFVTPSGGSISLFDGFALFLASPVSIWWVCQPPLVDQYPRLTELHSSWLLRRLFGGFVTPSGGSISSFDGLHSSWLLRRLFGGFVTPSGGSISSFDGLALFLASPTSIWWVCQPPLVDQYPCF